jgi:hypothetical protein
VTESFAELGPGEHRLEGAWLDARVGGATDEVDRRIFWLVRSRLRQIATVNGGWDQLFVDPRDGRYWELTFPHGSLHGGGPRRLSHLSPADARAKYSIEE